MMHQTYKNGCSTWSVHPFGTTTSMATLGHNKEFNSSSGRMEDDHLKGFCHSDLGDHSWVSPQIQLANNFAWKVGVTQIQIWQTGLFEAMLTQWQLCKIHISDVGLPCQWSPYDIQLGGWSVLVNVFWSALVKPRQWAEITQKRINSDQCNKHQSVIHCYGMGIATRVLCKAEAMQFES